MSVDATPRAERLSPSKRALLERMLRGKPSGEAPTPTIPRRPRAEASPLSFAQQRLWFIHQIDPSSPAYNVPNALRLRGALDRSVMQRCLEEVLRRHESLRTRFLTKEGSPLQVIGSDSRVDLPLIDLTHLPLPAREAEAQRLADEEAGAPFDLAGGPLMRVRLVRLGEDDHIFLLTMHHIVSDGWSMGVLVREVAALYEAFAAGRPSPLPPLPIQYADFAAWQREKLSGERLQRELAYWRERLTPLPAPLDLPADRPRPAVQTFRGGVERVAVPSAVAGALRGLARREGATLFMGLLTAFDALLSRLTGEEDVTLGTGIANRTLPELESLIGFFVNALVLRVSCKGDPSFRELLRRVREETLGAFAHQDLPFERLVEELQPVRDLSRNPIFPIAFALQNAPMESFELPGLSIDPVPCETGATRFDLEFHLWEGADGGLDGYLFYSADLFDAPSIRQMAERYTTLLASAVAEPESRLSQLRLIPEGESERAPIFARGAVLEVAPKTACEQFEEQAVRASDAPALEQGGRRVTYGQLDAAAGRLAARLRAEGVGRESRVAVLADRSIEQVTAVLAAAKSGAAYLPLDPANPDERLASMLARSNTSVLLTTAALARRVGGVPRVIEIDGTAGPEAGPRRDSFRVHPADLAYVIFTSGSTGEPNGVEVTHANLASLVAWHRSAFGLTGADRTTLIAGVGFDASVWELWPALATGACILIPDESTRLDPSALRDWLVEHGVTVAFLPTPLAEPILALDWPRRCALRMLLTGGDRLHAIDTGRLPFRVVNNYGPTEATVVATSGEVDSGAWLGVPTLGRPIANTQAYVLDSRLRPVPVGVPGELYVGGAGVARGYAGRPELTAARFLPDAHGEESGARLYRTGDRVRQLVDGRIEFLGRLDAQVKVRGHRVEPAEVETLLAAHPDVERAAVVLREEKGERRLVAYVVPRLTGRECTRWEAEHLARWRLLYDETYGRTPEQHDSSFNITGWNSSYTGGPIDAEEMREWRDDTVERIVGLRPCRVLEIGCGTGLLLTQIAPRCRRYVATDFSGVSLELVRSAVAGVESLSHVELLQRAADDFEGLAPGSFDTVILNSVVQYFPDAEYLERVLRGAVSALADGGRLFIGDVRDARLHRAFAVSVALCSAAGRSAAETRVRAELLCAGEEELLVDPGFFAAFAARDPRPAWVEARLKRGRADNELTRFRYDAVLHLGTPAPSAAPEVGWGESAFAQLGELFRAGTDEIVLRGVPNARVAGALAAAKALWEGREVGEHPAIPAQAQHPDDMARLGAAHGYVGVAGLTSQRKDLFDVAFVRGVDEAAMAALALPPITGDTRRYLTNAPLLATLSGPLGSTLREFAASRLPEPMVPSTFVVLDALPLTPNGKVDRRALPEPAAAARGTGTAVAPRTAAEREVARVWADVLRIERVGATDNFFDLGGHSLLATQVISRLRSALGVEVPLRAVFEAPTVESLAAFIDAHATPRRGGGIPRLARRRPIPLSFAQQRLWFLHKLEPGLTAYNIPNLLRLMGSLSVEALGSALTEILRRHEALRTRFVEGPGGPEQIIEPPAELRLAVEDLSAAPDPEAEARGVVAREALQPFDLARSPLLRARLIRLAADQHLFLLTLHHIASDGWSMGILVREVAALYEAFAGGRPSPLPELPIQYADFAVWQRETLSGKRLESELAYWHERLTPLPPRLELPSDRPRPQVQTFRGGLARVSIPPDVAGSLRALAEEEGATLFMVLLAAFNALLTRLTGEEDIAVGTAIANRTRLEIEPLIGFFVNTLVLRVSCAGDPSFRTLLGRAREAALGAFAHQDLPFERLVEELQPARDLSRNPIFQIAFALQNAPTEVFDLPGLEIGPFPFDSWMTRFDLEFHFSEEAEGGLEGLLFYSTDLFDESSARRITQRYKLLLTSIAGDPERRLSALRVAADDEVDLATHLLARGAALPPTSEPVHRLFERNALRIPLSPAVEQGGRLVTYAGLDEAAEKLAERLRHEGVGRESRVAVFAARSIEQVTAVLAVAKSGGAYVPIDPENPERRIASMLRQSGARLVLAPSTLVSRALAVVETLSVGAGEEASARVAGVSVIEIDGEQAVGETSPRAAPRACQDSPAGTDLAYVIFTSGSTGEPNGVEVTQANLGNLVAWHRSTFGLTEADRATLIAGVGFDASVWELWPYLASGACLLIPDDATRLDPPALRDWLVERGVTFAFLPTPLAQLVLALSWPRDGALRALLTGGDRLHRLDVRSLPYRVVNNYGPTETTVVASSGDVDAGAWLGAPTLGRPIANARTYVLDPRLRPAPLGVAGELYVGGAGVARGYAGRSSLTAKRFLPDPYSERPGERMYRTGDRVRQLADGRIEFLGRVDAQVKVRGHRIEPGEVEAVLTRHPRVGAAAVVAREEQGETRLVAYVTPRRAAGERAGYEEEHIARWRDLYDATYGRTPEGQDVSFNLTGWNSSYTGKPIPPEEMREWRDQALERILDLAPQRILEIGCGTGLLLTQLAPRCERYVATDFSHVSLELCRRAVAHRAELAHVELHQRMADDFDGWEPASFDVVVLNSVVQYFPDAEYLERVLEGAMRLVAEGGHLFVGDVRDARLHRAFAASVALYAAPDETPVATARAAARQIVANEEELLVSPGFFAAFAAAAGRGAWAEALLKRGLSDNELTRFRYDAVLHIGTAAPMPALLEVAWGETARDQLQEAIRSEVDQVVLRGVPNGRVAVHLEAARLLEAAGEGETIGALRAAARASSAVHPDDAAALGGPGWGATVGLSAEREGLFDVAFARTGATGARAALALRAPAGNVGTPRTNLPLRTTMAASLAPAVREFAAGQLPEAMVPSIVVVLEALPLTPNGKVDRRALPAPAGGGRRKGEPTLPRTPAEREVARIWAELLAVERVGATDNFFDLGGHSLLATQMISRLRSALKIEIPLRAVFEAPTVEALAALIEADLGPAVQVGPIRREDRSRPTPLSFAQQRLWFLDRLQPEGAAYNIASAVRLDGRLDIAALQESFAEIVRRHETLRTRFVEGPEGPEQVVDSPSEVRLPVEDVSRAADPETEAGRLRNEEALRPFDLSRGPLLRARLLRLAADQHIVLVTLHHIVSDGWSMGVLVRELGALYEAFSAGRPSPLPELAIQYADFSIWQRAALSGPRLESELAYWRERLLPLPGSLDLPGDRPPSGAQGRRGARLRGSIEPELAERLRALARSEGATLYMVLLAAYALVLARWAGAEDFAVGTPVANRTREETEGLIGFFVNTLVLRVRLGRDADTFRDLLARIREEALGAYSHQDVPFETVIEALRPPRDLSRSPIFQIWFNLVNVPEEEPRFGTLVTTPLGTDAVEALFDLSLYAFEEGPSIALDAVYNADFFDAWRMEELLDQLTLVLREAADSPGRALADFSLVTHRARTDLPDTRARLSETWHGSVQDRFAERAANRPSALAVADSHGAWSYGELDARANRLARWLLERGVRRGDAVAVWAHRSASTAWAMLGALKAGAAVVLLDPSHPAQRLAACLEEARPKALLEIEEAGAVPDALAVFVESGLGAARAVLPPLGAHARDLFAGVPADPVGVQVGPDDIACITFTSGSTGTPKGVRGRHGSLSHFQPFLERRFGIGEDDRFSMLSGLAHDPLQRDVFTPLMAGGAVCVPAPADLDPARLARWAARERVTVMHLTPAMAKILAGDIDPKERRLDDLRLVFLVGEQLMRRDVERLRRLAPEATLVNLYGTTETQRAVGHLVLPPGGELRSEDGSPLSCEVIPVGVGMEDVQLLIRDEAGREAGLCEIGEVWVRSPHLALGYLDDDLTHERFVGAGDHRAYRTGDWGRYLRSGVVTIAGRRDQQVNVRGFRIELGEVESALASQAGIRDAVAVLDGEDRLVGYVTASAGARLDPVAVREATRGRLPDYMVPAAVVVLDELPLTPNRKVDRRALPAPRWSGAAAYVAPRSPDEEIACALFAEVLGVDRVGTADSFFDLGGHSLLATRLVSRARSTLATEVSLRALFEAPTPAGLARAVAAARRKGASPPPHLGRAPEEQRRRLSYAQTRLWFLDRLEPDSAAYNVATALRLSGDLDTMALGRAVAEIERRHEALRTRLVSLPEGPEQSFDPPRSSVLTIEDLGTSDDSRREALRRIGEEASQPFDLTKGPLWRVRLLRAGGNEHFLSLVLHHAITDGWSMDLILRELVALYGDFSEGRDRPLPDLPIQYADWAAWQRAWLEGGELDRQLAYWRRELDGVEPLEIPTDRPRSSRRGLRGASLGFELGADDAAALIRFARAEGATLFHVLLACFQALLACFAGSEDVVVGTPVANRTLAQAEPLVGFFANTLPVRTRVESGLTLRALVRRVGEKVLEAYAHQDAPFESIVDALNLPRDLSRNPLFDVMFLLQHAGAPMPAPGGLVVEPLPADTGATPFDLTLAMADSGERIFGSLLYDADLFEATTIERLLAHFAGLVRTLTRNPESRLGELDLRSEAERAVTGAANSTAILRPPRLVQALVEERAARAGSADAIVDEGGTLSYAELDALSNRIARRLRRHGVGPEAGVGLLTGRTARSIAGILGIFKSGGVLVPLDASLPTSRLDAMLSLSGVRAVVSERGLDSALASGALPVVRLEAEDLASESAQPLEALARPSNAAYVIFTSGSTGEPKGVVVEHHALAERTVARAEQQGLGPGDRVLHFLSPLFDAALDEILPPLSRGAALVVHPDPRGETPEDFLHRAAAARLTVAHLPVGLLHELADDVAKSGGTIPESLRLLVTGGESPSGLRIAALLRASRGRLVVSNAYGPTEAVVVATEYQASSEGESLDPVPIGRPVANTTVHLLDARLRSVPLGASGEIFIGGSVLARGYAGRSAHTAVSFIPDPFSTRPGERLYRTGDLARRLANGDLVFLGRRDRQVKLRGFRVELGEIETALTRLEEVCEAAVVVQGRGAGATLVAYVTPAGGTGVEVGKLRAALASTLPDYMVPSAYISLAEMPRTATGKVNRRALPPPERATRSGKSLAPRDNLERTLAALWAEALGEGGEDIEENFFQAGGNSLLAVRIVGSIRRELNAEVPVAALFREPTIAGLARLLRGAAPDTSPLVTLKAGAGLPPLVCVHEVGGGVSAFAALADYLDPRRPVLGIHAFADAPSGRIEEAAAGYAGAIARAVPEGPVDLLGWSYGGLVAYEMALRLREAGRDVRTLVLLDAPAPVDGAQEGPGLARAVRALWGIEVEEGSAGDAVAAARAAGALPTDLDGEQAEAWLAGVAQRIGSAESYHPRPYEGRVVLVRGTESAVDCTDDDMLGWRRFVTGDLALEWAPGSHHSMVRGDGARAVAAIVERHAARTGAADIRDTHS